MKAIHKNDLHTYLIDWKIQMGKMNKLPKNKAKPFINL